MKEKLLGYEMVASSAPEFFDMLTAEIFNLTTKKAQKPKWLACINPHSYASAKYDTQFSMALSNADWLVPDGIGVVLASRVLGGSLRERITGSDVFSALHYRMNKMGGLRVFFLGSNKDTLSLIVSRMAVDYPNIHVAGTYSPSFKSTWTSDELNAMINIINKSRPDVLWVGMTAPKQEKWINENLCRLEVRFAAAIGAVFDFYSGKVKRSHPIFQRLGLEWLPRLLQQLRRLWRRMFMSAPVFLWDVMKERVERK